MSSDLVDWHRIEVVQFLAASFHGRDQIGLLEDGQMFANRLPCHIEALTEIVQRLTIFGPQAILRTHLPDGPWEPLVTSFGYCIGFIMAVLSRQQLFTESTITAVLPVAAEFTWGNVGRMMRLWGIVLVANLAGTLFAALFCSFTPALPTQVHDEMLAISRDLLAFGWWDMVFRAIASGFLMAAMVWLLPGAERTQLHVIALVTWLIAVGGFTHIVAGSVEALVLLAKGYAGIGWVLFDFAVPALLGNIIGGTVLFAVIAYAQVMKEI